MNIYDHSSVIPRGIDAIEGQNTFLDTLTDQVVLALKRAYVEVSELRRLVNSASSVSCESAKKIFYLKLFMLVIPEVHAFSGWDNRCMDILRVAATIIHEIF